MLPGSRSFLNSQKPNLSRIWLCLARSILLRSNLYASISYSSNNNQKSLCTLCVAFQKSMEIPEHCFTTYMHVNLFLLFE